MAVGAASAVAVAYISNVLQLVSTMWMTEQYRKRLYIQQLTKYIQYNIFERKNHSDPTFWAKNGTSDGEMGGEKKTRNTKWFKTFQMNDIN